MKRVVSCLVATALLGAAWPVVAQTRNLPSSKQLIGPIPGHPQQLNSLPISMAISPGGRYIVTLNAGFGTVESNYEQSLAVLDTQTGALADFPDDRTVEKADQTLYSGLAFSPDGAHIYASMASLTNSSANGIAVYKFADGKITPDRFLRLPLQPLAKGRTTLLGGDKPSDKAVPYPAAIAVVGSGSTEKLLVADNLADNAVLIDAHSGSIDQRFDLSESAAVPATYPVALALDKSGQRAFVALWNASEIVELDLLHGAVGRKLALLKPSSPIAPGTHPSAFALTPDGKTLYVALSNRDAVAAVDVANGQFALKGYFDTRLPGQTYFGAEPVALALNADGSRLYVADFAINAVAVIHPALLTPRMARMGMVEPVGFVPTEWLPLSMAFLPSSAGGTLYLATDKSKGTGPNNFPQPKPKSGHVRSHGSFTYIASLLHGSLATLDASTIESNLSDWTKVVVEANRIKAAQEKIVFTGDKPNPIKHVIYIIKENRSYDQVFGDLRQDGKPVGNGDPSLTMYGQLITPNLHKLALQFGVLDNFFDSGEISGQGHVWSTAAIGSDYLEKTWPQSYRAPQRTYDYEGVVSDGYPLLQHIPDVNQPASGYLWTNLAAHGKTYYHFAEYISSIFCNTKAVNNPQLGPQLAGRKCKVDAIAPGSAIPEIWGGGINRWPWAIPLLAANIPTKPELVGHFAPEAPDFNLMVPDQIRANVFLRHFNGWLTDRKQGRDTMPDFVLLRLPDDHTAGTRPGGPSPRSSVADNDLAVGRVVDAVSHSPYWDDTAIFILEDDAQNGGDHVDAHRSLALIISKYAPHGASGAPFVDSHFYSTVSVIRTMESLLGLPPMNNNDAFCSQIASLFTGPGDQQPYAADYSNEQGGLIYLANAKNAAGARQSMKMDFSHADRAPAGELNLILWKDAMGNKPVPAVLKAQAKQKATPDRDDD